MNTKPVLKASEVIYKDKIAIRKDRELRRKKRMEINKKIDDILKEVSHIDCDKAFFVEGEERKKIQNLQELKEELYNLSNSKKYGVSKEFSEEIIFKEDLKKQMYNKENKINELKVIDVIMSPELVINLREEMGLNDIAEKYNINYKALRNWCYSRGVNKMMKGNKIVKNRWKNETK